MKVSESIKVSDKMTRDLVTVDPMASAKDTAKKMGISDTIECLWSRAISLWE